MFIEMEGMTFYLGVMTSILCHVLKILCFEYMNTPYTYTAWQACVHIKWQADSHIHADSWFITKN